MPMAELLNEQDNRERMRAAERLETSTALRDYADILLSGEPQDEQYWQWLATASEAELIVWAEDARDDRRNRVLIEEIAPEWEEDWQ
jgi:hypothetical protein